VVGTTCSSPTGFDTIHSSFAYLAGGAVVVVDVSGEHYSQRFYRARPAAVPLLTVSPTTSTSTPASTPKANDSRNRAAASPRDSLYASADWPDSPSSKTWTSRERIKAATCLSLSQDGRYLAVGETGYAPRVLIFNLQEPSSDVPLVSISEHTFGVKAVAWSPDTKYLASLGAANDGFLYLWKVDSRTGAVKLFQQNRCTSFVKEMIWMGNNVITLGVRHVKVWRVEDGPEISPTKSKFTNDAPTPAPQGQKPLSGRNILLGSMLDATFSCALSISDEKAIVCSETGFVCLLDDTNKQMKLAKVLEVDFSITCVSRRGESVYVGGKEGQLAIIQLDSILNGNPEQTVRNYEMASGLSAMGFLAENLVTINSKRSIDIWSPNYTPGNSSDDDAHIPLPGLGDPVVGIERLSASNNLGASFFTWSGPGRVSIWDLNGMIKSSFDVPIEQVDMGPESGSANQVVVVKATNDGSLFIAGDRLGVLRVVEVSTGRCLLETKAHSSNCQDITIYEGQSRFLVASCGRDRTVQLFQRTSAGAFEHFQTLEFGAKVVQVLIPTEDKVLTCSLDRTLQIHDLVSKDGEPDVMAAIPSRVISLKASPSSMTVTPEEKVIFVSLLDRSVCQYEYGSGRILNSFKCSDESGLETVVLESLIYGQLGAGELPFLLGISNTDKSVRVYDAQAGSFMDREWGHTEAINGVILVDNEDSAPKVVSVGEDGTIMIWALDFQDASGGSRSRDPSPEKAPQLASARPPLRRVLSKAELAEFQRPTSSAGTASATPGRRSPPRPPHRRPSKFHLHVSSLRTPTADKYQRENQTSPTGASASAAIDDTPSRRGSSGGSDDSAPPPSPTTRASKMHRRPSLPALGATPSSSSTKSRKNSSNHHRGHNHNHHNGGGSGNGNGNGGGGNGNGGYGFGSLSMATEQTCRQLRAFRKKLASSAAADGGMIQADVLAQLDAELRLTAAVLGERAIASRSRAGGGGGNGNNNNNRGRDRGSGDRGDNRGGGGGGDGGKQVSETVLSGLLDQYSERLVSLLDEKLRLRLGEDMGLDQEGLARERPRTAGEASSTSGGSLGGGTVCEEPGVVSEG
jgi:WD40 repeat protein